MNGTAAENTLTTNITGETSVVFAVVVNAAKSAVTSMTAVINGSDVTAAAAE